MMMSFSGNGLDRASEHRADPAWIAAQRAQALILPLWQLKVLVHEDRAARLEPHLCETLAGPGAARELRLRAAVVALSAADAAGPLRTLAFDENTPVKLRADAADALAGFGADPAGLARLARSASAPARVRVTAARALPPDEAAALLTDIATGDPRLATRIAAINVLDLIDEPAAGELFGRLVRDRRVGSLRRRAVLLAYRDLLADEDAARLPGNPLRLLLHDPARLLSRPRASAT